jgi:hypothetical protein
MISKRQVNSSRTSGGGTATQHHIDERVLADELSPSRLLTAAS